MYKIDKESFNQHRLSIIRNQDYAVVRKESFNELENCSDLESHTHRSVASRVFKNHDIATARASHASAIAEVKLQEAEKQRMDARQIAGGFQEQVNKMNRDIL